MERKAARTKGISYLFGAALLLGACVAAGIAWKIGQHDLRFVILAVSAVLGLAFATRLGVYLVGMILSDAILWDRFPLEQWLPVKRRWLRLLTLGPLALIYVGLCWMSVMLVVSLLLMAVTALLGAPIGR